MKFNIMVLSTPEWRINDLDIIELKNLKKDDPIRIIKLENIGTLDITQLLNGIYHGVDGILVFIRGEKEKDKFISEYSYFHKLIDEANRILKKRGLSDQRIRLCQVIKNEDNKLSKSFEDFIKRIIKIGPNPIRYEDLETYIPFYN